jgi:hypothetical protein
MITPTGCGFLGLNERRTHYSSCGHGDESTKFQGFRGLGRDAEGKNQKANGKSEKRTLGATLSASTPQDGPTSKGSEVWDFEF